MNISPSWHIDDATHARYGSGDSRQPSRRPPRRS